LLGGSIAAHDHGQERQACAVLKTHTAHVKNGRLVMDEPTELPEGTTVELVSLDDVWVNSDAMDDEERAALERDLAASFEEEAAGQLLDASEVLADLRSKPGST
jgi:hypothetical protein